MKLKTRPSIIYIPLALVLLFAGLGLARGGDLFLGFLGNKLRIDAVRRGHVGFISSFVLKSIELLDPVFALKDFDIALGCQQAFIEPRFDELISKKTIILRCTLKNASLLDVEKKIKSENELLGIFGGSLSPLFDRLANTRYDVVQVGLVLENDTVHFPYCEASSKNAILRASGSITTKGDFDIRARAYFSPEITRGLPEALIGLLTVESNGWLSYYAHIESQKDKPFLKVESDRFKLNFEKIEVQ